MMHWTGHALWVFTAIQGDKPDCWLPCCRVCGAGPLDDSEIPKGLCQSCRRSN